MKSMLFAVVALVAFAAGAQEEKKRTVFPVHPSKMAEFNAKTGGLVEPPADIRKVVFLDARKKDASPLTNLTASAGLHLGLSTEVRKVDLKDGECPYGIAKVAREKGAGAAILFIERENFPTLSVYPEDAISVVNVLPLLDADYPVFRRRLVKEFWRSLSLTLGGYACGGQLGSVMQPVFSLAELDEIRGFSIPPPQVGVINGTKPKLKLFNPNAVPYSRACREGWAPAPTNDVQRKIYERFRNPTARFNTDFPARPKQKPIAK